MEYLEFDLDSAIATETAFTDYSSLDTPVFQMGRQILNVVGFKIIETTIPTSYYTITDDVNKDTGYQRNRVNWSLLQLGNDTGSFNITPNRTYTAAQLASEIQSKLPTTAPSLGVSMSWAVAYNSVLGKFEIIMTPTPSLPGLTLNLQFDESVAKLMGFLLPNSTAATYALSQTTNTFFSFVSAYIALVSGPNYMQINSKFFSNVLKNYLPQGPLGTTGQTNEAICQVPIYTNFGGISTWQTSQNDTFNTQNLFQLDKFDLYLTLGTSKIPLKLNGLSWQCKIRVFMETNSVVESLAGNVEQARVVKRVRQP